MSTKRYWFPITPRRMSHSTLQQRQTINYYYNQETQQNHTHSSFLYQTSSNNVRTRTYSNSCDWNIFIIIMIIIIMLYILLNSHNFMDGILQIFITFFKFSFAGICTIIAVVGMALFLIYSLPAREGGTGMVILFIWLPFSVPIFVVIVWFCMLLGFGWNDAFAIFFLILFISSGWIYSKLK